MYAWIDKNEVVDVESVVAVLDSEAFDGKGIAAMEGPENNGDRALPATRARTVILMKDGTILLAAARKKAVVKWLSQGRLERTGVNKIG